MQRTTSDGLIISCDFCGTDWDPYDQSFAKPMVEGHKGSIICLDCVKSALAEMEAAGEEYRCVMCTVEGLTLDRWRHLGAHPGAEASAGLNADAVVCIECIKQAAGRFDKDKDVDWVWER